MPVPGVRRSRHSPRKIVDEYTAVLPIIASFRFRIGSQLPPTIDQRGCKTRRNAGLALHRFLDQFLFGLPASIASALDSASARDISECRGHSLYSPFVGLHNAAPVSPLAQTVPSRAMPHDQARDS